MPGQPGRLVCWFRNFLMGRPLEAAPWLRHPSTVAPRTPPVPPNLPGGPAHKLENNYYFSRDLRRSVAPPQVASVAKQLMAGEEVSSGEVSYPQTVTPPTPGIARQV